MIYFFINLLSVVKIPMEISITLTLLLVTVSGTTRVMNTTEKWSLMNVKNKY